MAISWAHIHLALNHVPLIGLLIVLLLLAVATLRRSTELRGSFASGVLGSPPAWYGRGVLLLALLMGDVMLVDGKSGRADPAFGDPAQWGSRHRGWRSSIQVPSRAA